MLFFFDDSGGGSSSDPYWSNVKLLIHPVGSGGSSSFTDQSLANKTITPTICTINDTVYPFGNRSVAFPNDSTNRLTVTDGVGDFVFTGPWTVEAMMYHTTAPGSDAVLCATADGRFRIVNDDARWVVQTNGSNNAFVINSSIPIGSWYHLAFSSDGTTVRFWKGGIYGGGGTYTNPTSITNSNLIIGRHDSGIYYHDGYMANIRVTMGIARYTGTGNITPPTNPYPTS